MYKNGISKTINLPEKTSDNKNLPKKKVNKKRNKKEIKIESQYFLLVLIIILLYKKMEFQKITNFIRTTSDNKDLPTFVTKKLD